MASVKGRTVNSWIDHSVKLVMKVVLDSLMQRAVATKLTGQKREDFVVDRFWQIFPRAQEMFEKKLTAKAIYGRAMTPSASTKRRENPNIHPMLRYYVPAGAEILRRYDQGDPPMELKELKRFCKDYAPKVEGTVI